MTPRERIVRLLIRLMSSPYRYTSKDLQERLAVSKDILKEDIRELKNAGLDIEYDRLYRIAILPNREYEALNYLHALTEEDKAQIHRGLDYLSGQKKFYLRKKIDALYDFQQLGIAALRQPALKKYDTLELAIQNKKQVVLESYRSQNSNKINDRVVEPFKLDYEIDLLQAFEPDRKDSLHFRISRAERVHLTEEDWHYEGHHRPKETDIFGIADNKQETLHMTLDLFAYTALTERFVFARKYLEPGSEPDTWDLQCSVNQEFKGLLRFSLAHMDRIIIHKPETLKARIKAEARKIIEKI